MGILDLGRYKGIVFAITGFLVFIAIILAVNHGKAGQFSDDVSAVKFLAEQREQPGAVYAAGVELAARLKNGQKIDEPLEALRKAAKSYDTALSSLANGAMITDSTGNVFVVPALAAAEAQGALANGKDLWNAYKAKLDPVLRFSGSPYAAPDAPAPAARNASGKGAFRRFKDVLMTYAADRERWFAFRSERLRTFMEAWLNAHAIQAVPRPGWSDSAPASVEEPSPDSLAPLSQSNVGSALTGDEPPKSQSARRQRNADSLRGLLKELADSLGPRELDLIVSFAEFLKARRAARGFAHHHEHMIAERETTGAASPRSARLVEPPAASSATSLDKGTSTS